MIEKPSAEPKVSSIAREWFEKNTFNSDDFSALEELLHLKEEQRISISLGLPALNVEETVGAVIKTIKRTMMEEMPILDEMILIDSGSSDSTCEIAADLGIPVYVHRDILPQYGTYQGKGEAIWKSLYILGGDIVAWIDTDIANIHQRFVYGILGPLLKDPLIQYVKGFYRRPFRIGEELVADAGGRVTELVARPLINIFFPELSGIIQPLAGEFAGRRQILERLQVFTGYGIEIGLLIDILRTSGLNAIAQVDLKERIHRHQSLQSLSKMSFSMIEVMIQRLEEYQKIQALEEINKTMNLIQYTANGPHIEPVKIDVWTRPAMIELPEYRQKRGLAEL